jgi:hypothetical protein
MRSTLRADRERGRLVSRAHGDLFSPLVLMLMSGGAYALDVVLLGLVVCSAAVTGWSARRLVLPTWVGPPARLAESVAGVAALVVAAEVLGSVDEFRRWPVVATAVCVAAVGSYIAGKRRRIVTSIAPPPRSGRAPVAIAAVAAAGVLSRSLQSAADALHSGMLSFDTLWYHLPFAARFAQAGSLRHLHYVGNGPTTFYPATGELVHGAGMLLFQSDVLSPFVNVAWLGLALLAGWCVGRPYGVAPATLIATCIVAFLPVMGGAQAGTAGTDVAVLALLLTAVALLVTEPHSLATVTLAGVAAGLAVGTKLDAWAAVVALTVVVILFAGGQRLKAALVWSAGVAVAGGFWYIRNLAAVGNPFPWFGARVDGLFSLHSTTAPSDCGRTSVAHYVANGGFLSAHLLPQLSPALGARWWLILGLAAIGTGAALVGPRPLFRALAVVALATAVAYLFTPATAGGHDAQCFAFNTRFATPALAVGLILLPLAVAARRFGPLLSVLALATTLALTAHPSHRLTALAAAFALLGAVRVVGSGALRRLPRPGIVALAVVIALLAVLGGRHEQQAYARTRYVGIAFSDPVAPIAAELRRVHNARIAVLGLAESYPLYGADLSNFVNYPARRDHARFLPYETCRSWLRALARGRYDYVVTARESTVASPAAAWTRRYPAAHEILASTPGATSRGSHWTWQLYRLDPTRSVDPASACASHP